MTAPALLLRHGCNPHQKPAALSTRNGSLPLTVLNGEPGYINLLDALNSWQLVRELDLAATLPSAASFKHVSPSGAAVGVPLSPALRTSYRIGNDELSPVAAAYARARGADRVSSYGDWVALSRTVDRSVADVLKREFSHGIIAPGYDDDALGVLRSKMSGGYKILQIDPNYEPPVEERREVFGLVFEQRRNDIQLDASLLGNIVCGTSQLPQTVIRDMLVALTALKYTQSNSVCFAADGQIIGMGAGQQSRIHCTMIAAEKAKRWALRQLPATRGLPFRKGLKRADRDNAVDLYLRGNLTPAEQAIVQNAFFEPVALRQDQQANGLADVVMASDGYLPFRDNIDQAVTAGVRWIVQPGGSKADEPVIEACEEYGITMVFTGVRLFHH